MLHDPELHYLDNAATTIVAPEVADVIDKAMREHWAGLVHRELPQDKIYVPESPCGGLPDVGHPPHVV